jgi:hypothetical protein
LVFLREYSRRAVYSEELRGELLRKFPGINLDNRTLSEANASLRREQLIIGTGQSSWWKNPQRTTAAGRQYLQTWVLLLNAEARKQISHGS